MPSLLHPLISTKPPRQLAISLDRPVLNGMTPAERNTMIRRRARLLMEAASMDPKEIGDDERGSIAANSAQPQGGRVCASVHTDPGTDQS